ncbi:MAG: hypothetical protein JXR95_12175 [Deltaproteobacteria bacterium]|nr:hypothetical protein [Deltaproteobacteria bacterium]
MRTKFVSVIILVFLFSVGCEDETASTNNNSLTNNSSVIPVRTDCTVHLNLDAASESSVHLSGTFNEWQLDDSWLLERDGYTWRKNITSNPYEEDGGAILLSPGEYQYKIVKNGDVWELDYTNPYTAYDKTQQIENSLLILPDCSGPYVTEEDVNIDFSSGAATLSYQIYRPGDGSKIIEVTAVLLRGEETVETDLDFNESSGIVTISAQNLEVGKYKIALTVISENQGVFERKYGFWMEEEPKSWDDMILYSIFVDRFNNGDASNDAPIDGIEDQINWHGGDWKGITLKLREGFFEDLGITSLWISTPMDNPDYALPGDCDRSFSGYHAYWPQAAREVENHFGTVDDLKELVQEAHSRGIRVLIDWAANHIFIDHPLHEEYFGNQFWFNYPGSILEKEFWKNKCGYLGWNEYALTCWFTEYLPDYNHRNHELLKMLISDAMWWIDTFDLDGFRVDATKHIRSNYLRLLRKSLDDNVHSMNAPFYMVGENFLYDYGVINEKISSSELHGQFDFPMYGAIRTALLGGNSNLLSLNTFVYENLINNQYITGLDWGLEGSISSGTLMGTFLGNHDVERFSSVAAGQANGDGCQAFNEPLVSQPQEDSIYQRMSVAFGFLLTVRGLPVIYYGDEYGQAGVKDPDNRRPMEFSESNMTSAQIDLKNMVSLLNKARTQYPSLRKGSYDAAFGSESCLVYLKRLGEEKVFVVLGGNNGCQVQVDIKSDYLIPDGTVLSEVLFGTDTITVVNQKINLDYGPWTVRVFSAE